MFHLQVLVLLAVLVAHVWAPSGGSRGQKPTAQSRKPTSRKPTSRKPTSHKLTSHKPTGHKLTVRKVLKQRRRKLSVGETCTESGPPCGEGLECDCGEGRRLFGAPTASCSCATAPSPPPPPLPPPIDYGTVVNNGESSCGIFEGFQLWCWGQNPNGEFGAGAGYSGANQNPVLSTTEQVELVASGQYHNCMKTVAGVTMCSGSGGNGRLGNGGTSSTESWVAVCDGISFATGCSTAGLDSATHGAPTKLAAGAEHSAAVMGDGTLKMWGRHTTGAIDADELEPVTIDVGGPVKDIALGPSHACVIVDVPSEGTVRAPESDASGDDLRRCPSALHCAVLLVSTSFSRFPPPIAR